MTTIQDALAELAALKGEHPERIKAVQSAANAVRMGENAETRARNAVAELDQRQAEHIQRRGREQAREISRGVDVTGDAPDDLGRAISSKLLDARLRLATATAAVEALAQTHVSATTELRSLESRIKTSAERIALMEGVEKAADVKLKYQAFAEAVDRVRAYGAIEVTRSIGAEGSSVAPEIMEAVALIAKLPARDDLNTPVNILRGEGMVLQHPHDLRVAELTAI